MFLFTIPVTKKEQTPHGVCSFFVEIDFIMTSAGGHGLRVRAPPLYNAKQRKDGTKKETRMRQRLPGFIFELRILFIFSGYMQPRRQW